MKRVAVLGLLMAVVLGTACGGDVCGDGICGETEDRESCPEDCAVCGDGYCDPGETVEDCPEDCLDPCTEPAEGIGEQCMAHVECGHGGACLRLEEDPHAMCHQICVPAGCPDGNLCADDEICVRITNMDPFPGGQEFGVCRLPAVGDQGAYEPCGQGHGNCDAGLMCVGVAQTHGPFCAPYCGGGEPCPPASNDMAGSCMLILEGSSPEYCALVGCTGDESCPNGMECVSHGGGHLCLWPL